MKGRNCELPVIAADGMVEVIPLPELRRAPEEK